jgi:hypothetical protein
MLQHGFPRMQRFKANVYRSRGGDPGFRFGDRASDASSLVGKQVSLSRHVVRGSYLLHTNAACLPGSAFLRNDSQEKVFVPSAKFGAILGDRCRLGGESRHRDGARLSRVSAGVIEESVLQAALLYLCCQLCATSVQIGSLVKGGEYTPETIPEVATIQKIGCGVVILPLVGGATASSQEREREIFP